MELKIETNTEKHNQIDIANEKRKSPDSQLADLPLPWWAWVAGNPLAAEPPAPGRDRWHCG